MVEFGSFVGYTATRMGRAVELSYETGYRDESILFEDSRLQGANRITSMEIDPVHACIARHVLDLSRLSHIVEVWIGQVKDLIPRLTEEHGDMTLNMVFMDQRGTTFHDDLSQLEELGLMFPNCRIVADNCVKPGSPVYCWHTTVSERYKTTNYSLNEFLESTIEDWQVVCDYLGPLAGRPQHPPWNSGDDNETWHGWLFFCVQVPAGPPKTPMVVVKLEPKVWFSTERTFIHWAKLATVFAAASAVLLTTGETAAVYLSGLVVSFASVAILLHACVKQWKRNRTFKAGGKMARVEDFADRGGAILLASCLTLVVIGMVLA
eukprot:symbB.v1.2.016798.t1/scaffold1270.1/size227213/10